MTQDRVGSFGSYYPYGEDKGTPLLPNDQWKFATYTRDSASGLDYAMNRYYSSAWGRFGSADVAVTGGGGHLNNPQSFNQYAYAGGDPSNNVDPSGHDYFNPPFFYDDDLYGIFGPISVSPPPFGALLPAGVPSDWVAFGAYITALIDPVILQGIAALQGQATAGTCPSPTSPISGTFYLCIHQSGSDWNQLLKDLSSITKKLAKDTDCLKLLESNGANLTTIDADLNSTNFSLASGILSSQNGSLAGTTNDLPGATPMILWSALFLSTPQYQANVTILHELAHLLKVFGKDSAPGASALNDQTIERDCAKTLGR